jgi:hypothetical protein
MNEDNFSTCHYHPTCDVKRYNMPVYDDVPNSGWNSVSVVRNEDATDPKPL